MEHLTQWTVVGLRPTDEGDVWFRLGSYSSVEEAQRAAADPSWVTAGFVRVETMPYFEVDYATATDMESSPVS